MKHPDDDNELFNRLEAEMAADSDGAVVDLDKARSARTESADFFGAGIDYYQAPPLPVMQLFWPDKEGRFPWDGQAEEYCRASQPLLWIPKDETSGPWADLD
ncbi:DUF4262 domain-containing protein [Streptomyces sp. NPDC056159]|uniref:DUF4262 domain-containing protein n=1 Tax=Streptomyces sp. NPDC056159 TaxID=3155537 RepID=UPI003447092D